MTDIDLLRTALADRYAIDREVGSGGMATVYLAEDLKHDREVAIKVLRVELAAAIGTDRFLREIKIAARLTHPHILPLHDSGKAGKFLYYVMPYIDGSSLRERIRRERQLAIDESVQIVKSVAAALEYAHGLGVIHRDIKPDNILFNAGEPLVADFGIALAVSAAENDRLTETGLSLGTPAYMSPEQASGESDLDARSDVYSLACMLYEMLAGQPPFVGPNVRAVMARHVTDPVPPLTTVRPSVGEMLDRVVRRALAKVPMDRFATPKDFARALTAVEGGAEVAPDAKSIAVLPFANMTGDTKNEVFTDGLTDEILGDLSRLQSFQVISRTSAMQLKGMQKDVRTIGRELNVRYVVEGSVRTARGGLRVTAQLVDAAHDKPLWADKFDGTADDPVDLQEKISAAVVDAVRSKLGMVRKPAVRPQTHNVHAYESYLRARTDIWRFTEDSIVHALQYLQEALGIVGEDVLLYAAIAEGYFLFPQVKGNEPERCLQQVRECAERIFELEPDSAYGHLYQGLAACKEPELRAGGIETLQRALATDPDDPAILFWNGYYAAGSGDVDRASSCVRHLLEVNPRSPTSHWSVGWSSLMAGRFDDALEAAQQALRADPENPFLAFFVSYSLACNGRLDEAYLVVEAMVKLHPHNVWTWLGRFYLGAWQGNRRKGLRAASQELKQAARLHEAYSFCMAECYAMLDENAQGLEWLDNAVRRGFLNHEFLTGHARFLDNLRGEERFNELIDRGIVTSDQHES